MLILALDTLFKNYMKDNMWYLCLCLADSTYHPFYCEYQDVIISHGWVISQCLQDSSGRGSLHPGALLYPFIHWHTWVDSLSWLLWKCNARWHLFDMLILCLSEVYLDMGHGERIWMFLKRRNINNLQIHETTIRNKFPVPLATRKMYVKTKIFQLEWLLQKKNTKGKTA